MNAEVDNQKYLGIEYAWSEIEAMPRSACLSPLLVEAVAVASVIQAFGAASCVCLRLNDAIRA